ncbi:MAG: preprotein translocase subunit SecG [Paracoccus sp. (in: a-proteobacteria)]|nr:preprotein translocase subunit SecG [Paracoccus sp. (in: a-proteobacteria)]
MENVVLTVHLILALLLIGVVLLQRSEGGGLGMGGGGGGGGVMTGRQAANALTRMTWIIAAAFIVTSISLTVIAARNATGGSVLDQLNIGGTTAPDTGSAPQLPTYTPPPGIGQPVTPPAPEGSPTPAPATDAAAPAAPVAPPAADAPTQAPAAAPATPPAAN